MAEILTLQRLDLQVEFSPVHRIVHGLILKENSSRKQLNLENYSVVDMVVTGDRAKI